MNWTIEPTAVWATMKKEGSEKGQIWSFWMMNHLILWKKHFEPLSWDKLGMYSPPNPADLLQLCWSVVMKIVGWLVATLGAVVYTRGCHLHWTSWEDPLVIFLTYLYQQESGETSSILPPSTGWFKGKSESIYFSHETCSFPACSSLFHHSNDSYHQGHASPQLATGHHQPQHQHPLAALERCHCSAAAHWSCGAAAQCRDLRLLGLDELSHCRPPQRSNSQPLPSGKHTKNDGKSLLLMGKFTIDGNFQYVSLPEGKGGAINACQKAGHWQSALQLLEAMDTVTVIPNVVTFNSVISACEIGAPAV